MSRCLLTGRGLAWLIGLGVIGWIGLFVAAGVLNRWTRGKGPIYGSQKAS